MTRSDIIYVVNYAVSDEEKKLQRISLKKEKKKEEAKYRVTHLTNDLSF